MDLFSKDIRHFRNVHNLKEQNYIFHMLDFKDNTMQLLYIYKDSQSNFHCVNKFCFEK